MVVAKQIQAYAASLARTFHPERIVLFGSRARGAHAPDSDVDLLVVMRHRKRNVEQALEIDRCIHRTFPLDLIVRKPSEIRQRLAQNDVFLSAIFREGKTLYAGRG